MGFFMKIKRHHWIEALWWLGVSSIGALMPIWLTWFLLALAQTSVKIDLFTQNGEFALYSASLMSASIYVVTKDYATGKLKQFFKDNTLVVKATFPAQTFFITISFLITLMSALIFAFTVMANLPGLSINMNIRLVTILSLVFFAIATLIGYLITAIDNSATEVSDEEVRKLFRKGEKNLKQAFDSLDEE